MHFSGWVPTVIGRLSFTAIGCGKHPSHCWKKEDGDRFVIMQCRDLLDVILPFAGNSVASGFLRELISKNIIGKSGRFLFVMTADISNDGENCFGYVYLVPVAENRKLRKKLRAWFRHDGDMSAWGAEYEESISKAAKYTAKYDLQRGGRAIISPQNSSHDSISERDQEHFANQVFFFLKDISHVHQHHDSTHDAITEVTKLESDQDEKWIHQTRNSLLRAIIRYKRFRNEKALFRSAGILAYLKSFQEIYKTSFTSTAGIHAELFEKSVRAAIDELKHIDSKIVSFVQIIFSVFFGLFGFIVSVSLISRLGDLDEIQVDEWIKFITKFSAQTPLFVLASAIFISIIVAAITHRINLTKIIFTYWLTRTLQSSRRRWFLAVCICMAAMFYWLCFHLLFSNA